MEKRRIGRLGIEVSAMGLGCWAIGGQFYFEGKPDGYGQVDDEESIRAIQQALDLGINFFDTSDAYGVGHSEKLIGRALAGRRDQAVIATKFGYFGSQDTKTLHGVNLSPDYIERACDASLKRLNTDYIDLYLLHVWEVSISELNSIGDTLDRLVAKGKIRSYGWSTDLLGGAELFSQRKNCVAIEQQLTFLKDLWISLNYVKREIWPVLTEAHWLWECSAENLAPTPCCPRMMCVARDSLGMSRSLRMAGQHRKLCVNWIRFARS